LLKIKELEGIGETAELQEIDHEHRPPKAAVAKGNQPVQVDCPARTSRNMVDVLALEDRECQPSLPG
jgi:hypothetical protein